MKPELFPIKVEVFGEGEDPIWELVLNQGDELPAAITAPGAKWLRLTGADGSVSESTRPPQCGHCMGSARGSASVGAMRLCHPNEGMDCYRMVTVYRHGTPCPPCEADRLTTQHKSRTKL